MATTPAYSDLAASPEGLDSLRVGLAPSISSLVLFSKDFCDADPLYANSGGYPGAVSDRWLAAYPDFGGFGFTIAATDVVTRIDVRDPEITTAEGIGIGSTEASLQAEYGDRLSTVYSGSWSDVYALSGTRGTLVFEVAKSRSADAYWPEDKVDRIVAMRIIAAGSDTAFATAATDNQAGTCV